MLTSSVRAQPDSLYSVLGSHATVCSYLASFSPNERSLALCVPECAPPSTVSNTVMPSFQSYMPFDQPTGKPEASSSSKLPLVSRFSPASSPRASPGRRLNISASAKTTISGVRRLSILLHISYPLTATYTAMIALNRVRFYRVTFILSALCCSKRGIYRIERVLSNCRPIFLRPIHGKSARRSTSGALTKIRLRH